MIASGILTIVLPSGEYERINADGRTMVVADSYVEIEKPDYPIWRWFTSPLEVLGAPGNIAVITIILFIVFVIIVHVLFVFPFFVFCKNAWVIWVVSKKLFFRIVS